MLLSCPISLAVKSTDGGEMVMYNCDDPGLFDMRTSFLKFSELHFQSYQAWYMYISMSLKKD